MQILPPALLLTPDSRLMLPCRRPKLDRASQSPANMLDNRVCFPLRICPSSADINSRQLPKKRKEEDGSMHATEYNCIQSVWLHSWTLLFNSTKHIQCAPYLPYAMDDQRHPNLHISNFTHHSAFVIGTDSRQAILLSICAFPDHASRTARLLIRSSRILPRTHRRLLQLSVGQ